MASAAPSALKNYGGYWTCVWRDSSGKQRWHRLGNCKKVSRKDAEHRKRIWENTEWKRDPQQDDWRHKTITVNELVDRFLAWAEGEYPDKPCPSPHKRRFGYRYQLARVVKRLREYGTYMAADFRPRMLREMREQWIERKLKRKTVNMYVGLLVQPFQWAADQELIPHETYRLLSEVPQLKRGRTKAKESKRVQPIGWATVHKTMEHCRREVAAMVELQWLTAMRSNEVGRIRPCDIDMSADVWEYTLAPYEGSTPDNARSHKTDDYYDEDRVILLGPRAQEIVKKFLTMKSDDYLFKPSSLRRNLYVTPDLYWVSVRIACKRAKVDPWHPHQLRHSAATRIRAEHGREAAQAILGHLSADTTEIYARVAMDKGRAAMAASG
ncbi:MAG: tyrosine-type recombinase/integrase [Planctomycetes bacterium]|nr:tyrosine-type recombinase/integrase [Planctomycetota bacterium]